MFSWHGSLSFAAACGALRAFKIKMWYKELNDSNKLLEEKKTSAAVLLIEVWSTVKHAP